MKKFFSRNKFILLILLFAGVLRLYKLGSIPPALTPDEAALGYNAYSILKTGKDEYGQVLPMIFKSFGDYKPGLYVYTAVPSVALFGLNEFATRLPSALAGVAAIYLLYLILKTLKDNFLEIGIWKLEILAPAMLAINPWHIQFSRGAWEVNLALTLSLAGIYFFLKALDKPHNLLFSSFFFALTLLTYQGAKLSTTIILIILIVVFWREFWQKYSKRLPLLSATIIIGLIVSLPILLSLLSGKTGRLEVYSVFSYPRKAQDISEILVQGNEKITSLTYYLYHSEALNFTRGIAGRWFNHMSDRFLFFQGDWSNPRHSPPNQGMMLMADLIFILAGLAYLFKTKNKLAFFTLLWVVLAPLPAVLSRDSVHGVRAFNMVVPLTTISGVGFVYLVKNINVINMKLLKNALLGLLLFIFSASFIYYLDSYFVHLPKHDSKFWSYGYKQIVETVTPIQDQYKKVKVQQSFAQPYIYFLFYQKYPPQKYQQQAKLVDSEYKYDVGYVEKLDNIYFTHINWGVDRGDHGTLLVADPIAVPIEDSSSDKEFKLVKEIKYLNGETAFRILEIK
jgi:4-amino-4-deoxy-L-arabinose transferase-like glycosyltransferase